MSTNKDRLARFWRDSRATVAVEMALLAPLLLFMVMVAVDVSLAIRTRTEIQRASYAGAIYAVFKGYNVSAMTTAAQSATSRARVTVQVTPFCSQGVGVSTLSSGVCDPNADYSLFESTAGKPATYVQVVCTGSYMPFLVNFWKLLGSVDINGGWTFTQTSTARIS